MLTGSVVPGQAEASPLTPAEGHAPLHHVGFVFVGQQSQVLQRESRGQRVKHQQHEGSLDTVRLMETNQPA